MRGHSNIQKIGRIATFAALMALTIANRNALAEGERPGRGGHMMHRALASLNLNEDQKTKVKALADLHKGDRHAFRDQMRADHEALKSTLDGANPDPTAVGKAFLKVRADRQAVKAKMQDFRQRLSPILTPEQNARLDGFISAMRPTHGGRGRHGQGRDGGSFQ